MTCVCISAWCVGTYVDSQLRGKRNCTGTIVIITVRSPWRHWTSPFSTLLGYFVDAYWLAVPCVISALMLQSAFSGFCPAYFTLGKLRQTQNTAAS